MIKVTNVIYTSVIPMGLYRIFGALNYHSLISHINIPSLVSRGNFSKLILLYKINNGLLYFPPNVLIPVPAPLHYSRHYNKLKPPFCSTQDLLLDPLFLPLFTFMTHLLTPHTYDTTVSCSACITQVLKS